MTSSPSSSRRWVFVADTHGDKIDPHAWDVARKFIEGFKPEVRIAGGDHFDLRWLRRSASDDEKAQSVASDFEAGVAWLDDFKPTHFLWGNHDYRLIKAYEESTSSGAVRHLCGQWLDRIDTTLRTLQTIQFPWCKRRGVFQLGDTAFIHGYGHGINVARQIAMTYGNSVQGHVHRYSTAIVPGRVPAQGITVPCLCDLNMDYTRGNMGTLAHEHGFAYGWTYPNGVNAVFVARKIGDTWILPTESPLS
jgi:hypothetical protein